MLDCFTRVQVTYTRLNILFRQCDSLSLRPVFWYLAETFFAQIAQVNRESLDFARFLETARTDGEARSPAINLRKLQQFLTFK